MPSSAIVRILLHYGALVGKKVRIQPPFILHNADQDIPILKNLTIGDDCYIGRFCLFDLQDRIEIGNKVTISHHVTLNTHTNAGKSPLSKVFLPTSQGSIIIESGVYLGLNVTVLQGVNIGQESLIGANSLVNTTIPAHVSAFGQPCRIQKQLSV